MIFTKRIDEVRGNVKQWRKQGLSVALVPTMGYLHEGHISLIKKAVSENDKVVVSVFVNPIQFGPNEDLDSYPRDIKMDKKTCETAGASMVFNPEVDEMYYDDACTTVSVSNLTSGLCGAKRPVHFNGVCTVVSKLFNIVSPDKAYFGEKDAQQLAVIKRMVRDLSIDIKIIGCPIVREEDGLAKSSRNKYLSKEERKAAVVLSRSLNKAKEALSNGEKSASVIKKIISDEINKETLANIDYIEIVDSFSLENVETVENSILTAIAVLVGKTRLIDNFTWKVTK
jgi:pantoate--beta-alanine ligase